MYFDIVHTTHYRYARPVALGLHRVLFRPRDSHDLRVLATDMQIYPPPQDVRLIQDAYSNSVALVQPHSPASEFKVVCNFSVENMANRALDFPLAPLARNYPFFYDDEELLVLTPFLRPYYDDPDRSLLAWARQFISNSGSTGTRDLLLDMTQYIGTHLQYRPRWDEGVQSPYETLRLCSGSCRDFATLMIEAIRYLGYAARFVSGYLYSAALDSGQLPGFSLGSTHAWLQVYLPGAGWVPFDPTNNIVGGIDLIRVGVARHASLALPICGTWNGYTADYLGMEVDVQVRDVTGLRG